MGLCLSGVLPDGVWSEWGFAQWAFALDSYVPDYTVNCLSKHYEIVLVDLILLIDPF